MGSFSNIIRRRIWQAQKFLNKKKLVVDEIVNKLKTSESVIIFQYQGLTVEELSELRKELKNVDSEVRVYKKTHYLKELLMN